MNLPTELDVLLDTVTRLDRAGLPYMLTGSLATSYYAEPRMTRDIDLVVAASTSDVAAIQNLFGDTYYLPDDLAEAIEKKGFFNLIHLSSVTKVDIIVRKTTPYRLNEFGRRRQVTVADVPIWVVSKEDLMLSKLEWARDSRSEVQLRDIRSLAATGYDGAYLSDWVAELGLDEIWNEATGP